MTAIPPSPANAQVSRALHRTDEHERERLLGEQ
jgi:hypothetical protein